ncbi:Prefoldin subunit-domain-containing protein [Apiospora phragmitis]|uniref:Prefoldin subunit-domain-containing protein n=1 Tax=Apiospora phragmitis TaxID=2905665 RepID=A0ABR1UJG7_9PEZI
MSSTASSFIDVERHRQTLEQNLIKLEEALDEWRQWKSEYESLKKEVSSLPANSPSLTSTREAYHGDLVNEKELQDIFGKGDLKTVQQVISVLTNRIDYVSTNISSLENQLEAAQNKFAAADVFSNPNAADEGGLPITEIMEELDDDDNVLSYSLQIPADNQAQLLDALKKAGLAEAPVPPASNRQPSSAKPIEDEAEARAIAAKNEAEARANAIKNRQIKVPMRPKVPAQTEPEAESKAKKGVSFAEDTKTEKDEPKDEIQRTQNADQIEELMRQAKAQEEIISEPNMLSYNLSELNPVVAELTLEEGDYSGDDFDSEEYSDEEDDEEEEDRWGRSTKSMIDDDYRQKMIEIQERLLGHRAHHHQKKDPPATDGDTPIYKTKGVRFAPALDVADEKNASQVEPAEKQPVTPFVEPLSADIVERKSSTTANPAQSPAPAKKTSRFKSNRAAGPPTHGPISANGIPILPETPATHSPYAPSGPEGKTLADAVLEHDSSLAPKEPDELDAGLLRQEAATEYYKMRNRLIQKQGGFMKEDENPIQPLDEEEGGPKRLSRFRAARLAKP